MLKEIGGYFGLELSQGNFHYHQSPYRFKSGRASLHFILNSVQPSRVYVPFYTCDALLDPFIVSKVPFIFYRINKNFEIVDLPALQENELLVYVNYYDLKREYVDQLSEQYKEKLVVDCTQSYFLKGNNKSWYFNSARKFFGVPDGSDLYTPGGYDFKKEYDALELNNEYLVDHLLCRFNGNTKKGYDYFVQNERLNDSSLFKMSKLSSVLLSNINFDKARHKRSENFNYLHGKLANDNQLSINRDDCEGNFYPFLPARHVEKKMFWNEKIFVPSLWLDCLRRQHAEAFDLEKKVSADLLPIPIDHRCSVGEIDRIIEVFYSGT